MTTFLVINAILLVITVLLLVAEKYLITYGDCAIIINKDRRIDVDGGDHILNYLNQHKIFIPSACGGKATCGLCKVQVTGGAGKILPTEESFIDREERAKGMRLACQVKVKGKVEVQMPEFMLGAEEFQSTTTMVKDVTHDIKHLEFKLEGEKTINFKPGQYIQIKIPGTDEFRAYSVASPPYITDRVELTIRLVPGGLCSTYVHSALEEGDRVTFTGPFGDFHLREDSTKDIIGIAGGCGMAPIRSIAMHMAKLGMKRRFWYFFGARTTKDLFFTEELREMERQFPNFKYIPALSEPTKADKWDGEVGFITTVCEKHLDPSRAMEAYLCGPPPMIDAAEVILKRNGIKHEDIMFDKF